MKGWQRIRDLRTWGKVMDALNDVRPPGSAGSEFCEAYKQRAAEIGVQDPQQLARAVRADPMNRKVR